MHHVALQCVLYFAAFCYIGRSMTGSWQTVLHDDENWGKSSPDGVERLLRAIPTERAATYRRKAEPAHAKTRILFIDYTGVTWSFSPRTATWTPLSTTKTFKNLRKNTITSLCGTKVVAYGGYDNPRQRFSDARISLFDGESEEWAVLNIKHGPSSRFDHKAFAHPRKESTCKCKESLFVYGGYSTNYELDSKYSSSPIFDDFWELRCVDDRNMKYTWIKINTTLSRLHSLANWTAFSVSDEKIYWLTPNSNKLWIFEVTTNTWSPKLIDSACPSHANVTFEHQNDIAYVESHKLAIFQANNQLLGVYHVKENRFQCVDIGTNDMNKNIPANVMVLDEKILLLSLSEHSQVQLWELQSETNDLLHSLNSKRNSSGSRLYFKEIPYKENYPVFKFYQYASILRISNAVWYLILVEDNQKVQMWRFEIDNLRWTLYDPDQIPETRNVQARKTAFTKTKYSSVAYFGSNHNYSSSGSDDLWVYDTNVRTWTRVPSLGNGPKKLTSFATMDSLINGELVLFGGIDNKKNSLWVATVNFSRMKATWKRICCNGPEAQEPTKHLNWWSSAVWNNAFYVYFGKTKNASCEWTTYYTKLGISELKWTSVPLYNFDSMKDISKEFCYKPSTAVGRFAITALENGDLLIKDLSHKKLTRIIKSRETVSTWKQILVGSGDKIYSFITAPSNVPNTPAIRRLERFQLAGCEPGMNSSDYIHYPCRPCPMGQYSDRYGASTCTDCPPGLVTRTKRSISKRNCTCPVGKCPNGICIVQSNYTTHCICKKRYVGPSCETPKYTIHIAAVAGAVAAVLLIAAFLYCMKRVRKHLNMAQYTRTELEIAEKTVAQLSDIWSVDEKEVVFDHMIGQGSFGDVWTAQYRDQTVAVKILKIKKENCTNEQLQEFKEEGELLRSIFHANIVRFIGTGKTADNKPLIVLEYMERGSVRKELDEKHADHPMEIALQVKYALHAAKGMRHLHRINQMHRDLKCDNLLVNNKRIVKVADFGCTRIAPKISDDNGGSIRGTRAVGTAFFRAPEIFRGEAYSVAVDVYSYGITLWEIITAKHPYFDKFEEGLTSREILDQIIHSDVRPEFHAHCDSNLKKLAKRCWNGNPLERPTFEDIVPVLKRLWLSNVVRNCVKKSIFQLRKSILF